jgi:hypothetical protein
MQIRTLEKFIAKSPEIAQEAGTDPEVARRVMEAIEERIKKSRRQPSDPAPKGGISLRSAARKYGIPHSTLLLWIPHNYIQVLKKTNYRTYISEDSLVKYINKRSLAGKKLHSVCPINTYPDMSKSAV